MTPNPGHCPDAAKGNRVKVKLRNGRTPVESWPADGKGGARWTLTGQAGDIVEYEIV